MDDVRTFTIFAAANPDAELRHYLAARPALASHPAVRSHAEEAMELLAPFYAELSPLLPALAPLWKHNDLHASNLLWSDEGDNASATAIIDFGLADRTNAVHDLAHAIERNIMEWLVLVEYPDSPEKLPFHLDHLHAILDVYESVRPLAPRNHSNKTSASSSATQPDRLPARLARYSATRPNSCADFFLSSF